MGDSIFERDYQRNECEQKADEKDSKADAFWNELIKSGVMREISEQLDEGQFEINSEKKKAYEVCLEIMDRLAEHFHGKVRGEISEKLHDAKIELIVPFLEFSGKDALEKLITISEGARMVGMYPYENSKVRLVAYFDYFDAIDSNFDELLEETIEKHPEFKSLLETTD